jgi:hypothetical protein
MTIGWRAVLTSMRAGAAPPSIIPKRQLVLTGSGCSRKRHCREKAFAQAAPGGHLAGRRHHWPRNRQKPPVGICGALSAYAENPFTISNILIPRGAVYQMLYGTPLRHGSFQSAVESRALATLSCL